MYKIEEIFTEEEYVELMAIIGEYKRVARDQVWRFVKAEYTKGTDKVATNRFELAKKLLDKVGAAVKIT